VNDYYNSESDLAKADIRSDQKGNVIRLKDMPKSSVNMKIPTAMSPQTAQSVCHFDGNADREEYRSVW